MRLTRKQFVDWLGAQLPEDVVGLAMFECDCPIARFLKQGERSVFVGKTQYAVNRRWSDLPEWARAFIAKIDKGREHGQKIKARSALLAITDQPPNIG